MDTVNDIDHNEDPPEREDRDLKLSLPSPQCEDTQQKIQKLISEISLPTRQPLFPNRPDRPLGDSTNKTFYTVKRQKDLFDRDIYFVIKWACGILTVAASIVFGIWAPLSYKATISDNEAQDSMVDILSHARDLASTANIIASNALDTASAQHAVMGSLYSTMGLMGQLAVMEFCHGQSVRLLSLRTTRRGVDVC